MYTTAICTVSIHFCVYLYSVGFEIKPFLSLQLQTKCHWSGRLQNQKGLCSFRWSPQQGLMSAEQALEGNLVDICPGFRPSPWWFENSSRETFESLRSHDFCRIFRADIKQIGTPVGLPCTQNFSVSLIGKKTRHTVPWQQRLSTSYLHTLFSNPLFHSSWKLTNEGEICKFTEWNLQKPLSFICME